MEAVGSVLTNKYAEGYPGKRYYGGCEKVDMVEDLARDRACELYGAKYANVQPHCPAPARTSARIEAHHRARRHGARHEPRPRAATSPTAAPVNFSGRHYHIASYGVDPETETIDYDELERIAKEVPPEAHRRAAPRAYPRIIDFERMARHRPRGGRLPHGGHGPHRRPRGRGRCTRAPCPTPTSSPPPATRPCAARAAASSSRTTEEHRPKRIDKAVFPGCSGRPAHARHRRQGRGVRRGRCSPYKEYIGPCGGERRTLGQGMMDGGLRLVSGGTDNHLCLVDLTPADVTGKDAEKLLESVGLTVNKNSIPNEPRSPFVTSGIRVGSAAATTRGFTAEDFYEVGQLIAATVFNAESEAKLADVRAKVDALLAAHPLYPELDY